MNHQTEGIIVTCIDFRFQKTINKWISQHIRPKIFDRVALAGGVKNLEVILGQIDIAVKLHHIKKVILINHEDCGAYGKESSPQKHAEDLKNARAKVLGKYPNLEVEAYYLHLDGAFTHLV
ncbi:hypothetical protein HYS92_02465 [Candidatus Daviesbacteria bacterium]|nr:hypothetical protein [Candidatus Daviesbacteria bacterium]